MDATTRASLLHELDAGIERAEAEARKLREFRDWVRGLDNGTSPTVGTVNLSGAGTSTLSASGALTVTTLGDYLRLAGRRLGPGPHSVAEYVSAAIAAGWNSPSQNKPQMVRNQLARMAERGEVQRLGAGYAIVDQGVSTP